MQSITENILGKELIAKGFSMEEDDHVVTLKHQGEVIARYAISAVSPSIAILREACNEHLVSCHLLEEINGEG